MGSPDRVTSTKNPLVRRFRAAAQGEDPRVVVADGLRLAQEALAAGLKPLEFAWSAKLQQRPDGEELLARLQHTGATGQPCSDHVLERVSHLNTHQGIVVVAQRPRIRLEDLVAEEAPLLVVAAKVQDPGNLGALVRTAEAAGATGLLALTGSANPYRDKAVRGSMGSVFRLPTVAGVSIEAAVALLGQSNVRVVVAERNTGKMFWDTDLTGPVALIMGNEGGGVPSAFADIAAARVTVPIQGAVDSLNVAVAAGVLLFEARRQRS
jgi:TrmH family RNA methyltransferase